ncbi:MAG: tripartite tricarboxylate transporter TctB family protein [Xenococcaceae cyanobacterium MO_167.B27]|nr:tripartite tricarboxylate transporter TctB family protein [Xenococcaceae cyanobacterium MO_167.B27]
MSDRIFAGIILLFALYYGFEAHNLQVPFAYEPLGPKAFPLLLSILLAVFSLLVLYSPTQRPIHWPKNRLLLKSVLVVATLVGYSITLFWLGFILSTIAAVTLLALLFGANWAQSLVGGIFSGLIFYGLFDFLLQIPLPSPSW